MGLAVSRLEKEEGTCEVGIVVVRGSVNERRNELFSIFLFFSFPFFSFLDK